MTIFDDMTKFEEDKQLSQRTARGRQLFMQISSELNEISTSYIRRNKTKRRRLVDYREICMALALAEERMEKKQ